MDCPVELLILAVFYAHMYFAVASGFFVACFLIPWIFSFYDAKEGDKIGQ